MGEYTTVAEVKTTIGFASINNPGVGSPVSDADIELFITQAEEEVERIYNTRFGVIPVDSTATAGAASSLTDGTKAWTVNQYEGYCVYIYAGTGIGQYRTITSNTATVLSTSPVWTTNPDNTSKYRITKLGYKTETVDGSGTNVQYVNYQPLVQLDSLTIAGTSVTPSKVYLTLNSGRLQLKSTAEAAKFSNSEPQQVTMSYVYGVYPVPVVVKRLATILAGMRTVASQVSGTYDSFSSITMPGGISGSKGEPYTNLRMGILELQKEVDYILKEAYPSFTLFG